MRRNSEAGQWVQLDLVMPTRSDAVTAVQASNSEKAVKNKATSSTEESETESGCSCNCAGCKAETWHCFGPQCHMPKPKPQYTSSKWR